MLWDMKVFTNRLVNYVFLLLPYDIPEELHYDNILR